MTGSLLDRVEAADEPPPPSAFSAFFASRATVADFSGDSVLVVSDPAQLVLVEVGAIDLFAAVVVDGRPVGRWMPLCRMPAGAVLALGSPRGPRHTLIGRPVPGSVISTLPMAEVRALGRPPKNQGSPPATGTAGDQTAADAAVGDQTDADAATQGILRVAADLDQLAAATELVAGIDLGLISLERSLRHGLPPREFAALEPSARTVVRKGEVLRSVAGVQWIDVTAGVVTAGDAGAAATFTTGDRACITELDWLTAAADATLQVRPTGALLAAGELLSSLVRHAFRFGYAVDRAVERRLLLEREALAQQQVQNERSDQRTELSFTSLLAESASQPSRPQGGHDSRAERALAIVAGRQRITLNTAALNAPGLDHGASRSGGNGATGADDQATVQRICASSGVPTRRVRLVGRWWTKDSGPLIGYLRLGGHAVVLLPGPKGYLLLDPDAGRTTTVRPAEAGTLRIEATMLYRPLPPGVTGVRALLRFGLAGSRAEGKRFLTVALGVALIGLLVPVLTGAILGRWVPGAQQNLVVEGSVLVMLSAVVVAALTIVQNTAVLRLEGQLDLTLQAAVWARLLALPMEFFTRYAAAELGTVALGVSAVRETLSSVSTVAALGLVSGLLNLLLLFVYSPLLGVIAVGMVAVSVLVSLRLARRGIRYQRQLYRAEQKLSSRSYQFLSGLSTLRLAAAEGRAYARWSRVLAEHLSCSLAVRRAQAAVTVFNAGFSVLCSLGIFALVGGPLRGAIGVAAFLSFFTAFNQVLGAMVQFCGAAVAAMSVVPMLEGLSPILTAAPEVAESMAQPGDLDGSIEMRDVSFRYGGDGPLVLDGVSFDVGPGEFVALVGATGSGKSTILRLLLGFEQPDGGSILFDGQDMRRLDVTALRRQCGVVLQNGALLAGDIATNIIAGTGHSIDDAWRAADLAGIADDIRAMPMGMHTVIPEGGSTLSGGQRQRMMIARALISSPRMLFFDEATSALDNETQRVVTESTRRLNASRVVIAHRLSTIEHADRIIVLEQGRVAQIGSYRALLADPDGAFNRLVRRQMVDEVGR